MDSIVKLSINVPSIEVLSEQAMDYVAESKSLNTRKAYDKDWHAFIDFCTAIHCNPIPADPETVKLYVAHLAKQGYKVSTIQRHLSSISMAHKMKNFPSPTQTELVRMTVAGVKSKHGTAQDAKKAAVLDDIRAMVDILPNNRLGVRDRAVLLIGFAGAFRRSELVALNVEDIEETNDGLIITVRRSKTDQEGAGRKVGIPYGSHLETCPVRAYKAWLTESCIDSGAIFHSMDRHGNINDRMSDKAVALVVKRCAEAAGLDPSQYAGHSLRSGFATTAAEAGVEERIIMKQTGHKTVQMVRKYIQDGQLFKHNAAAEIGL